MLGNTIYIAISKKVNIPCLRSIFELNNFKDYHSLSKYEPLLLPKTILKTAIAQHNILYNVLKLKGKDISSSIIDNHVTELCKYYNDLQKDNKHNFILELSRKYAVQHTDVCNVAKDVVKDCNATQSLRLQEKLKSALTPQYKWLFIHVGRQENGVKFLVDMRTEVLELLKKIDISDPKTACLQQLNTTLRELFLLWFSVGFLKLERVTWKSSCEMLEKISDYEAVHPVRNWPDLKQRMGPDRRCFVYTHTSMPGEPLVILHTALRHEIASSTIGLTAPNSTNTEQIPKFNPDDVTTAVFYSISSTQAGLQGIELGNYLIKRVATELAIEFPKLTQFSSLSPIPNFKSWLYDHLKRAKNDPDYVNELLKNGELTTLGCILNTDKIFEELMKQLNGNTWLQNKELLEMLQPILMRMCIRYLYAEKKRGYALNSVANFHLRNGAEMWRLNWLGDLSARGLTSSCGMMVNYRYYLDGADNNSKTYIENKKIVISPLVKELLDKNHLG